MRGNQCTARSRRHANDFTYYSEVSNRYSREARLPSCSVSSGEGGLTSPGANAGVPPRDQATEGNSASPSSCGRTRTGAPGDTSTARLRPKLLNGPIATTRGPFFSPSLSDGRGVFSATFFIRPVFHSFRRACGNGGSGGPFYTTSSQIYPYPDRVRVCANMFLESSNFHGLG